MPGGGGGRHGQVTLTNCHHKAEPGHSGLCSWVNSEAAIAVVARQLGLPRRAVYEEVT
jgi:hypothetical protein